MRVTVPGLWEPEFTVTMHPAEQRKERTTQGASFRQAAITPWFLAIEAHGWETSATSTGMWLSQSWVSFRSHVGQRQVRDKSETRERCVSQRQGSRMVLKHTLLRTVSPIKVADTHQAQWDCGRLSKYRAFCFSRLMIPEVALAAYYALKTQHLFSVIPGLQLYANVCVWY